MKSSIIALSVAALLAFGVANAATPAAAPAPSAKPAAAAATTPAAAPAKAKTAQQQKMSDCSSANKGRKGDDYKKPFGDCMKAGPAPASAAQKAQQNRMTSCNADAGKQNLKGDARKTFMSNCLKKK